MQMIAAAMYCPYLSKKQQKGCFDTKNQPQMPATTSEYRAEKKQASKDLPAKTVILTLKPHN